MQTIHTVHFEDSGHMTAVADGSVDLVVTSPPYPMIAMWDQAFSAADPDIATALSKADGQRAFELMHHQLDSVWAEIERVLKPGALACINIGDATRTIGGRFHLFANHARIIAKFCELGLTQLPSILWRKTTNAPNKFMGSGMLPPGAYVTLEHEYILIFRKGDKRAFDTVEEQQLRRQSAYFWEERNAWFSDVWLGLPGDSQELDSSAANQTRQRSGAYPLELALRLINMFSIKGDLVLDPFLGTGTTMLAAMCTARHCLGYEVDGALGQVILSRLTQVPETASRLVKKRLRAHYDFVQQWVQTKGQILHRNQHYGFPVITRQEEELWFEEVRDLQYVSQSHFKVRYLKIESASDQEQPPEPAAPAQGTGKARQLKLF